MTVDDKKNTRIRNGAETTPTKNYGEVLSPSRSLSRITELCGWLRQKAELAERTLWAMARAENDELGELTVAPLFTADEICASAEPDANEIVRQFAFMCGQPIPVDSVWHESVNSLYSEAAGRITEHLLMLARTAYELTKNPRYEPHQLRRNIGTATPWRVITRTVDNVADDSVPDAMEHIFNEAVRFLSEGLGPHFPTPFTAGVPLYFDGVDVEHVADNYRIISNQVLPAAQNTALYYPPGPPPPGSGWHVLYEGDTLYVARLDEPEHAYLVGTTFTYVPEASVDTIANLGQLQAMSPSGHYRLTADIDATSVGSVTSLISLPFTGTLDGAGHTITTEAAVFNGIATGGTVKNLNIAADINDDITPNRGGLCLSNYGTITNCTVSGAIVNSSSTNVHIGGICSTNYGLIEYSNCTAAISKTTGTATLSIYSGAICGVNGGIVRRSRSSGVINTPQQAAGGICGLNINIVDACFSTADVTGDLAGGIAANNDRDGISAGVIRRSYANGSATGAGTSGNVGGIAGINNGLIQDSYAVMTLEAEIQVGGIVAIPTPLSTIRRCYAVSTVTIGIFPAYGISAGMGGDVFNCYFNSEMPDVTDNGVGEAKTEAEMQQATTYLPHWSTNIWNFVAGEYPVHQASLNVGGTEYTVFSFGRGGYGFGEGFVVRKLRGVS